MAERSLILGRDDRVLHSNEMDKEIAHVIDRALFHQKSPATIRIMNAKRNAKGTMKSITHPNETAEMAMRYRDIIITAAKSVYRGVVDVAQNESCERIKIHTFRLVRYIAKCIESLQMTREGYEAENEGIAIATQVLRLVTLRTIKKRRQNGEIASSSVVSVRMGSRLAPILIQKGIKATGVWDHFVAFTNAGRDSRCELCCYWGHTENQGGNNPKCGYCSGNRRTSDHKCNFVGCMAKQGSLCGHRLEKCPNWNRNHIAFSRWCVQKREATKAARQIRKTGTA